MMNTNTIFQVKPNNFKAGSPPVKKNLFSLSRRTYFRREKILEKDRVKRRNILFYFSFLLAIALISVLFLAFKPSILQDKYLINNIELLSNNEDLDFYNELEFYQWLDLSVTEK